MTTDREKEDRLAAARRRDHLCDRFERGGPTRPTIEDLLAEAPEPERTELLRELVALEVHYRRKTGEPLTTSDYLTRFPALDPAWLNSLLPAAGDTLVTHGTVALSSARTLGDYELLGELGRGGMGVVYRARQRSLKRLVALKVLRNADADAGERARLRAEAEAAARLQHPHIVQVFEVGECDGAPFLALELCDGGSLAGRLAGTPLPAADAASLVRTLAGAVQHAHERGVVHRDLKPANVLLAIADQSEQSTGGNRQSAIPKVADFGLARRLDAQTMRTQTGDVLGTPSYMAPEQASGRSREAGAAADVYALGAILYECLTGRPPFKAATVLETLEQVCKIEPVPPRQLQPGVPRDLNTICLHCLHKEPSRRYPTAQALADDLGRFLNGEPVKVHPVGSLGRLVRWSRRNPVVAGLLALVVVSLLTGTSVSTAFGLHARGQANLANERATEAGNSAAAATEAAARLKVENERATRRLYAALMASAGRAWQENNVRFVEGLLESLRPERTGGLDLRGFEWGYWRRLCHLETAALATGPEAVSRAAFSPDGRLLLTTNPKARTVTVWDVNDRRRLRSLNVASLIESLAFDPSGQRLLVCHSAEVRLCDPTTGRELRRFAASSGNLHGAAFSPDGRRIVAFGRMLLIWDAETGNAEKPIPGVVSLVRAAGFGPDGRILAVSATTAQQTTPVRVFDAAGKTLPTFTLSGSFAAAAFSPDATRLALATPTSVQLRDTADGKQVRSWAGPFAEVKQLNFSPDGSLIAAADAAGRAVVLLDVEAGESRSSLKHVDRVGGVAFRPGGQELASWDDGGLVKFWGVRTRSQPVSLRWPGDTPTGRALRFSPDGTRLALSASDHGVVIWDWAAGKVTNRWTPPPPPPRARVTLSPDVKRLLLPYAREAAPDGLAFSPDGRRLTLSTPRQPYPRAGNLAVFELSAPAPGMAELFRTPKPLENYSQPHYDPSGRHLAAVLNENVVLFDATTGAELRRLHRAGTRFSTVVFSPTGERLLAGDETGRVTVWDLATGRELASHARHAGPIRHLTFHPDGRLISASDPPSGDRKADRSPVVLLAGLEGGPDAVELLGFTGVTRGMALSPDGSRLATAADGVVRLWDTTTGLETLNLATWATTADKIAFSPNGRQLAAAVGGGRVLIWETD